MYAKLAALAIAVLFTAPLLAEEPEADAPAEELGLAYSNDFNDKTKIGDAWSKKTTIEEPADEENLLLGEFEAESISLTLKELPKHAYLEISFDFIPIRTWDGLLEQTSDGRMRIGPDRFVVKLEGGITLLDHAFSNSAHNTADKKYWVQDYPALIKGTKLRPRTASHSDNTLGFQGWGDSRDAVYKMKFVIPHTKENLKLIFAGVGLQEKDDESWALDNVKIRALKKDQVKLLSEEQLLVLCERLKSDDVEKAYNAAWELIKHGDAGLKALKAYQGGKQAPAKAKPDKDKILAAYQAALKDMGSADFDKREAASENISKLAKAHEKIYKAAKAEIEKTDDPEVRWRLKSIIEDMATPITVEELSPEERTAKRVKIVTEKINATKGILPTESSTPAPDGGEPGVAPGKGPIQVPGQGQGQGKVQIKINRIQVIEVED